MHTINFPHDPLRPLNRSGNHGLGPRAWLGVEEIVGGLQVTRHEDSRHDRQHAFSTFLHQESLAYSLFVRYNENCRRVPDFEALNWHQVSWFSENKLHA
jgi:hypothetical protein